VRCPYCEQRSTYIENTQYRGKNNTVFRRRRCNACGRQWSTIEMILFDSIDIEELVAEKLELEE